MRASIYLVADKNINEFSYVKIGYSNNPENRFVQLNTGPNTYYLISEYEGETRAYVKNIEQKLHSFLKGFRYRGEWFKLNQEQLIALDNFIVNFCDLRCHYHQKHFFVYSTDIEEMLKNSKVIYDENHKSFFPFPENIV
jgi:hypothetical protein